MKNGSIKSVDSNHNLLVFDIPISNPPEYDYDCRTIIHSPITSFFWLQQQIHDLQTDH